ncbi:DUF2182 domain-containing protein [Roseibium sediminicola]|uniref:DUF2182 domain-containing protein n=1 Tax=Roseibium sediminicola TaxID=2933272 RepID=A0ABT0GY30_9HYPH|nr:DUF2182 domain-containing protein [Roseibium sp. CAU 1639]MCK7614342.1 DUF2182 domain-containing protein [Roseibium sp. CAU 1639]
METMTRLLTGQRGLWLAFYGSVLAAWGALFAMQAQLPAALSVDGLGYFLSLCRTTAADAGFVSALIMWSLMALAMMAPTAFPAFRTYAQLNRTAGSGSPPLIALFAGYMTVWLGFAVLAAFLQVRLAEFGLVSTFGQSISAPLNGVLLLLAGAYQFSALKEACLNACQSPMTFFFSHWQPGAKGGAKLGLRLGAVCLGCCWALMLLAFVAGTMNLAFMGLAMVLMSLEKLPAIGARLTAPLGVFLILAGAVVLLLSAFIPFN